jgi:pimeloyl-ACP methyl ester carboxylesterase
MGRQHPAVLQYFQQNLSKEGPWPYDPEQIAKISAAVVGLWSRETARSTWVSKSALYLAQHVADGYVRELAGGGHFAPLLAPELLAKELTSFIESVRKVQRTRAVVPPHAKAARG